MIFVSKTKLVEFMMKELDGILMGFSAGSVQT
jgi:hypothetical protein